MKWFFKNRFSRFDLIIIFILSAIISLVINHLT